MREQNFPPDLDKLIEIEWDTISDLRNIMLDPEEPDRIKTARALAYHIAVLNKLLVQKGDKAKFDDKTLGDFIVGVERRIARHMMRDYTIWKRRLSRRR